MSAERTLTRTIDTDTTQGEVTVPVQRPVLPPPWHTPERQALQDQSYEFSRDEVLPIANELDPHYDEMPASLIKRLGELGYFGITIPKKPAAWGSGF